MQTSNLSVNNTESDHANAIFRQFQDAIFSREHTYVKTLTKIIFDLLQWQEIATLSLPKKAAIAPFILTTFPGHFCLRANDIARNRSRCIFSRACADIFHKLIHDPSFFQRTSIGLGCWWVLHWNTTLKTAAGLALFSAGQRRTSSLATPSRW